MKRKPNNPSSPLRDGRFNSPLNKVALSFTSSLNEDKRLYKEDIEVSLKYALALKEAKIIKTEEYKKISKGLKTILQNIEKGKFSWQKHLEDIHMNIEFALQKKVGPPAKKLHTGRSRNDQVVTDLRLYLMNSTEKILILITKAQKSILKKAKVYHNNIMPGFTHMQIAQPVTFGHHLMAWFEMLQRDFERFCDSKDRMSTLPLGSGALSGNKYRLDRDLLAKRLKFKRLSSNSIDAVSDRDFGLEFLSSASILGVHLSRISEELVLWSSSQFNYIEFSDSVRTGSSIMPQKKNPDVAELIRGGSAKHTANLVGLLTLMKNQPLAYNRDMQGDKSFLFDSLDHCIKSLEIFSLMIDGIKANTEKMRSDCNLGHITATELADYLVSKNIPFREAHKKVGKIVSYAEEKKLQIHELSLEELQSFSRVIQDEVKYSLIPEEAVKNKLSKGGTAPKRVLIEIKRATELIRKRK